MNLKWNIVKIGEELSQGVHQFLDAIASLDGGYESK